MNIVIKKDLFFEPVAKLSPISEKRSTMPILSNLLISFQTDKTTIYANDLDISAVAYIDFGAEEEKKILINGKRFFDILKEMGNDDIELDIHENNLKIKQKHTEYILGLQDPDDFPDLTTFDENKEIAIDGATLLEMIERVGFATSEDVTRHTLMGIFIEGRENVITAVGTDGFRMSILSRVMEGVYDFEGLIIPKKTINEVSRIINEKDKVRLSIGDNIIRFSTDRIALISKLIDGKFPDYRGIIPERNPYIAIIDRDIFLKSLRRISAITDKTAIVKLMLYNDVMELNAESDIGSVKEAIEIKYNGVDKEMNFSLRFLFDIVNHIEVEQIIMKLPEKSGAVLFMGRDDDTYKNITMPVKI
ncbi:MAG: DNA polymerase III subunit beta [Syntrophorhabdaceae bacterium]|nr:DNA polymerase III subunit beta [Syntrophorhabdales bacterium]MBP9560573.1 DNA polymerase III subunit beta [Syntrophorhabdaceae bacterium]